MSYVIADPELMTSAASDLASIGSNLGAAHLVAAPPTVAVIPAAADEVSAGIAHLFSDYAQDYQALAGQASAFHEQFVQHLTASAFSYADIEAAIASLLQPLTATVGAIGSTIGALLVQLINDFATFVFNNPWLIYPLFILGVGAPFLATITFVFLFLVIARVLADLGFPVV
jgi:hypothetical protein